MIPILKKKIIAEIGAIPNLPRNTDGVGACQREDSVRCAPSLEKDAPSGKLYKSCKCKFNLPVCNDKTVAEETLAMDSEQFDGQESRQDSMPSNIYSLPHSSGPNLGVARKIKKKHKTEPRKESSSQIVSTRNRSMIVTRSRVERLRNLYESGKLRYLPRQGQTFILQKLKLTFLTPMYMRIPVFQTFRILDYIFDYDSSGLQPHRNGEEFQKWFGDIRSIKRITAITYD
jgi:hypothetical protein